MFSKTLLACALVLITVEAAPRFPVPTRLRYGPTVHIAKAAAEAALGYAASAPAAHVAAAPQLAFGARVAKTVPLALSASTPIRAAAYNAYPAGVAAAPIGRVVAAPAVVSALISPHYAQAAVYSKAQVVPGPIYRSARIVPARAFAAPVAKLAPVATTVAKVALAAEPIYAPQAYSFGYQSVDEYGNRQSRQEQSDTNNFKKGSYSYTDAHGISRRVDYVADAAGFRATIATNEPGTAPSAPAAALYNAPVHRKAAA